MLRLHPRPLAALVGLLAATTVALAALAAPAPQGSFELLYEPAAGDGRRPLGVHVGADRVRVFTSAGQAAAWDIGQRRVEPTVSDDFGLGVLERGQQFVFVDESDASVPGSAHPLRVRLQRLPGKPGDVELELDVRVDEDTKEVRVERAAGVLGPRLFASANLETFAVVDSDPHVSSAGRLALFDRQGRIQKPDLKLPGLGSVRISRDGRRVFALHAGGTTLVELGADPAGGLTVSQLPVDAFDLRIAPGGEHAVLFASDRVVFWRADGTQRGALQLGEPPRDAAFAVRPGGGEPALVAVVSARKLFVVPLDGGPPLRAQTFPEAAPPLRSVSVSRNGLRLALGRLDVTRPMTARDDGRARVVIERGPLLGPGLAGVTFETAEWNGRTPRLRFLPGGDLLVQTRDTVRVLLREGS